MKENYADVLESYMIAEEGLFSKLKDLFKKKKINNKKSEFINISSKKDDYLENTRNVISRMEEECPEVIEKEISLRKSELAILRKFILTIGKSFNVGGFNFTSKHIDEMLIKNNAKLRDGYDIWCLFLENLLPEKSPKSFSTNYNKFGWCEDITVVDCNIYEWNDIEKNGTINIRDWEDTEEYTKIMSDICTAFDGACSKLKCAVKSDYYGDWDDGPIVILLKPSDEFIKVAKSYGWHE